MGVGTRQSLSSSTHNQMNCRADFRLFMNDLKYAQFCSIKTWNRLRRQSAGQYFVWSQAEYRVGR